MGNSRHPHGLLDLGGFFFLTAQKTQQKNQVEVGLKGSGVTGAVQNELPAGRKSFVRQKEPGP